LAAPAWAGLAEGVVAYHRGDYATALREFRPLAEQGDPEAQVQLGGMYQDGRGVPQDYVEAARWFHKAAEQGDRSGKSHLVTIFIIMVRESLNAASQKRYSSAMKLLEPTAELGWAEAQSWLGLMHYDGLGIPQDYSVAMKWFFKAAAQGNAQAQYYLGVMYDKGHGARQDYVRAVWWYRQAAQQGETSAQTSLGALYYNGWGVPQDYVQAHKWFNIAASQIPASYNKDLKEARENALRNRDIVATQMTPAQITEAQRLAREWKPKKEGK
jgi:TPR repeat protein